VNEDRPSNMRRETGRHFRKNKRKYLKDKIKELESSSKNKNIRDLCRSTNEFKKCCKPRTNLRNEECNLLANPHKV
jgi:hypothetical protein